MGQFNPGFGKPHPDLFKRAKKLSLTQREFAERYQIKFGRLRDIERGRCVRPDTALIAYLRVINLAPERC